MAVDILSMCKVFGRSYLKPVYATCPFCEAQYLDPSEDRSEYVNCNYCEGSGAKAAECRDSIYEVADELSFEDLTILLDFTAPGYLHYKLRNLMISKFENA